MTELYTQEKILKSKKRVVALKAFLIALMTVSLASAVALCFFVTTKNAQAILAAIIIEFTLSGWVSILVLNLFCLPAAREYRHMESLSKEETVLSEGEISLSPVEFQIPKSISIQKVTLKDGEHTETLSVNAKFAKALSQSGRVRVKSAKGYITGIEVIG